MSLSSTARVTDEMPADGVTRSWPFSFKVYSAEHVALFRTVGEEEVQVPAGQFEVVLGAGNAREGYAGGTVNYPIEPAAAISIGTVRLERIVPFTQTISLTTASGFDPKAVERQFDLIAMGLQQINDAAITVDGTSTFAVILPPTGVSATAQFAILENKSVSRWVRVLWTASLTDPILHYEVRWTQAGNTFVALTSATMFDILGLQEDVAVTISVVAVGLSGARSTSASANALTPSWLPDAPLPLTAATITPISSGFRFSVTKPSSELVIGLRLYEGAAGAAFGETLAVMDVAVTAGVTSAIFTRTGIAAGLVKRYFITLFDAYGQESTEFGPLQDTVPTELTSEDFTSALADVETLALTFGIQSFSTLPASGSRADQIILKTPEIVLYRWDAVATEWSTEIFAAVADGSITATKIEDGAITTPKLAALSVTAGQLAANAVVADKIAAGAIITSKIAAGSITAASGILADLSVVDAKIASGAVTSAKIADAAITSAKIGTAAITEAKIGNLAVTSLKIGNGAVITDKILDEAVSRGNSATGSALNSTAFNITLTRAGRIFAWAARRIELNQTTAQTGVVRGNFTLLINGVTRHTDYIEINSPEDSPAELIATITLTGYAELAAGTYPVRIETLQSGAGAGTMATGNFRLMALAIYA